MNSIIAYFSRYDTKVSKYLGILYDMKHFFLTLFCLTSFSIAVEPTYYDLDDFLKGAERVPNKCVNKGVTYKCIGYDEVEGAIFNTKTLRSYFFSREELFDAYVEMQCEDFYVRVNENGSENIVCAEQVPVKEIDCFSSLKTVKTVEFDELGILMDEKIAKKADVALCRNSFHHQYGSNEGKPYVRKTPKRSVSEPARQDLKDEKKNKIFNDEVERTLKDVAGTQTTGKTVLGGRRGKADGGFSEGYNESHAEGGSGGIGDGLAGMLGGGGGGIATKAKGSIRTPSERDIDISLGGPRSPADIMKVVRQRTPGLRHIYNKYLKHKPGFQGKVTLKLTIAPDGEIISISVASSTTRYGEFDNEVKAAVSRWKFSKAKSGNTTVTIPFTFSE